jgi:DNA-binding transcriptional regulator YdaS (Cro superfamily)
MKLRDYLTKHGLTQIQFGQMMTPPVSQARVSHWLNGRLRVSLTDAVAIERLTQKQVSVEDWLPGEVGASNTEPELHQEVA